MTSATIDAINRAFAKRKHVEGAEPSKVKAFHCVNGLSLSVQASRKHHCFPRNNEGPYIEFEVGFPSQKPPESWLALCTGDFENKAISSIYVNVPIAQVAAFIDLYGGIKAEETPQMVLPEPKAPIKRTFTEQRRYNITMADMGLAT